MTYLLDVSNTGIGVSVVGDTLGDEVLGVSGVELGIPTEQTNTVQSRLNGVLVIELAGQPVERQSLRT